MPATSILAHQKSNNQPFGVTWPSGQDAFNFCLLICFTVDTYGFGSFFLACPSASGPVSGVPV
jgi:hypothetical protein